MTQVAYGFVEAAVLEELEGKLLAQFSAMTGDPAEWSRLITLVYARYRDLGADFWCDRRIVREPERVALRLVSMGCWMEEMRRWKFAESYYRWALGLEPLNRVTWFLVQNNLGRCLLETGDFVRGETHCRAAVALGPHLSEPYWHLAGALRGQHRYYEAAEALMSAASGEPNCLRAIGSLEDLLSAHPDLRGELGEKLDRFRDKFAGFYPLEAPSFREFARRKGVAVWMRRLLGRR